MTWLRVVFATGVLLGMAALDLRWAVVARAGTEETRLGPIPIPTAMVGEPVFCPRGWHLAVAVSSGAGVQVYHDGKLIGPVCDGIGAGSLIFSPDSQRVAYAAERYGLWSVVVDGEPGLEYGGVTNLMFSPDSRRMAYVAWMGEMWFVVVDGQPGPEYDDIGKSGPIFSPDSQRVAYAARMGEKWFVVVDGEPGLEYDVIGQNGPSFHADGTLEFLAYKGDSLFRVRVAPPTADGQ